MPAPDDRYSRQTRFTPIGPAGQQRLAQARVLILGCGALGSAVAEQLCRAGVGHLRLVDRDLVESSNLQRQTLYTEDDADRALPKVIAAAARLRSINAACIIEPIVRDVGPAEIAGLLTGCDLAIDGADNFALRHLLNDACCRSGLPWIYGACVGAYGISLPILPGDGPCLRCLQDQLPAAGDGPTCDTAGIIAPAVHLVAAWQVAEALKLLVGDRARVRRELWASDLWAGTFRRLGLVGARDPACASCGPSPSYPALNAPPDPAITLCGRDAVQVAPSAAVRLDALAQRIGTAVILANDHLVRWRDGALTGTCFRDGRVIVHGVTDPVRARAFRDRWMG
ncbi:MAG: ThiF family adenylyltransferase [Planctomycetes bacterium]|nr:ThiF family adenylyltransferase [Planctomycetota bacterium]